jgi:hypothetical protein
MTTSTAAPRLTRTSPDLPPDLYGYAAMHDGMHRDAARLVRTLQTEVRDPDALRRWWSLYRDVIVRHHVREDDLLWPALADADPTFADEVASMHDDHHELDAAMDRLDVALSALVIGAAALGEARTAAGAFQTVLADHLTREELAAFHRLVQRPQLWAALERQIDRDARARDAAFELPWVLDGLDGVRTAHLSKRVPRPFRPIARRLWQPRYRRIVSAAHPQAVTA